MPSTFAFYRARGVAGTYVVGIQLDLRATESAAVVFFFAGYEKPYLQVPQQTGKLEGDITRDLYRIDRINTGDLIVINLSDRQLRPYQTTRYLATEDGFLATDLPYGNYGVITLNPITIVDCDTDDIVIQESPHIVETDPVQALPPKRKRKPRAKKQEEPHDNHPEQPAVIEDPAFQF